MEVNEFKYLRTTICKHGSMEGEVRERTVKGRQVMGAMKGSNVSMAVKKGNKEECYPPNTVICLRGMDVECSTVITN